MTFDFDPAQWGWDHSEYSARAVGDSGPWVWWLPRAWHAVADPSGSHPVPPPPSARMPSYGEHGNHAHCIAWWAPLLHLLSFGSGWVRPDLGLARWLQLGLPDEDPLLRVVARWWGPYLPDVLAWAGKGQTVRHVAAEVSERLGASMADVRLPDRWSYRRESEEWKSIWGVDYDRMHLTVHALSPVWTNHSPGVHLVASADAQPRAVLVLAGYEGWYKRLHRLGAKLPVPPDNAAWQVEVVVRPLGWLGSFRRSRLTGRWFSGQHRWHELGIDSPLLSESLFD